VHGGGKGGGKVEWKKNTGNKGETKEGEGALEEKRGRRIKLVIMMRRRTRKG
jgi:hypothetical protein